MPLPLQTTVKREVVLDGETYTVVVSPLGVRLVAKGFRKGKALSWRALRDGRAPVDEREDADGADAGDAAGDA